MTNRILLAVMASLIGPLTIFAQNWIIEPRAGMGFNFPFENGWAIVQEEATGLYGVIDTTGRQIMACQFINRPHFTNGQAIIQKYMESEDQTESYLLESNGRLTKLSVAVDFSIGFNYFGKINEVIYDGDVESIQTYSLFKIKNPEILRSGTAVNVLELSPVLGNTLLPNLDAFSHERLLIEDQIKYFIDPSGKTVFELPQAESCEPFDEFGYAQYMDADSAYLINTKNQKIYAHPRDANRNKTFYYRYLGDNSFELTASFLDEWESYLIRLGKTNTIRYLGSQVEIFPLTKQGRYWEIAQNTHVSEHYTVVLKNADGSEVIKHDNLQFDSTHGTYSAWRNVKELLIMNFDGHIVERIACDYSWYAGDGYMWVTQGANTGLLKIFP